MSSFKLIPGEDVAQLQRWSLVHHDARPEQESKPVIPLPTAEELAAIRQRAQGEGFEKGLKEGREAARKELQQQLGHLDHVMEELTHPLHEVSDEVEQELVALAIAMARQLIRRELQSAPEQIVAVVREALQALPSDTRHVKLFLHPEDAALVKELMGLDEGDERPWQIVEDAGLTRGGCRLQSEHSRIDATVEKRLNAVVAQLLGGERSDDESNTEH